MAIDAHCSLDTQVFRQARTRFLSSNATDKRRGFDNEFNRKKACDLNAGYQNAGRGRESEGRVADQATPAAPRRASRAIVASQTARTRSRHGLDVTTLVSSNQTGSCIAEDKEWILGESKGRPETDESNITYETTRCRPLNTSATRPTSTHRVPLHSASASSSDPFQTAPEGPRDLMEYAPLSTEAGDTQVFPTQEFERYLERANAESNITRRSRDPSPDIEEPIGSLSKKTYTQDRRHNSRGSSPASNAELNAELDAELDASSGASSLDHRSENSQDELGVNLDNGENDTVTSPAQTSPVVPAVTGQKRDRESNAVAQSPPVVHSQLAAMFKAPGITNGIGLSQVFGQTQAPSSPLADVPMSDRIFDHPGFESQVYNVQSSPILSTPFKTRNPETPLTREPKATYVPKRDSQKKREKLRNVQSDPGDEDELGEDSGARKAQYRKFRLEMDARSRREIGALVASSAPDQIEMRPKSAESALGIETPALFRGKEVIDLTTPAAPSRLGDNNSDVTDVEPSDEYDELSQAVISGSSQRKVGSRHGRSDRDDALRPKSSPLPYNDKQQAIDARTTRSFHLDMHDELNAEHITTDDSLALGHSQSVQVENTQQDKQQSDVRQERLHPVRSICSIPSDEVTSSQRDPISVATIPESSSGPPTRKTNKTNEASSADRPALEAPPSSPPGLQNAPSNIAKDNRPAPNVNGVLKEAEENNDNEELIQDTRKDLEGRLDQATGGPTPESKHQTNALGKSIGKQQISETSPQDANRMEVSSPNAEEGRSASSQSFAAETGSSNKKSANDRVYSESRSINTFETAPSHQSARVAVEDDFPAAYRSAMETTRLRHLVSFANSQGEAPETNLVDANYDDVLKEFDEDYEALISRPINDNSDLTVPQKKFRGRRVTSQGPAQEVHVLPTPKGSPKGKAGSAQPVIHAVRPLPKGKLKKPNPATKRNLPDPSRTLTTDKELGLEHEGEGGQTHASTKELSPTKNLRNRVATKTADHVEPQLSTDAVVAGPSTVQAFQAESTTDITEQREGATKWNFPKQIWARFKGLKFNYYPATVLYKNGSEPHASYTVKFYDGNVDSDLSASFVRSLELKRGDVIKIDRRDFPKRDFVIHDLRNVAQHPSDDGCVKDVNGHQTLLVAPKQRQSGTVTGQAAEAEVREVPIADIYLTNVLWGAYADRTLRDDWIFDVHEGIQTPDEPISRSGTPSSRNRRQILAPTKKPSFQVQTSALELTVGLFSNMVFAVSYGINRKDKEKDLVLKTIVENGGRILSGSFEDLFEKTSWLPHQDHRVGLKLSENWDSFGFVALIADGHSRRIKFMQALALNIPCLSGRWIMDSVSRKKLLPWMHYLLPAGNSDLLGGALRSRTFSEGSKVPHDASVASLRATIDSRQTFLRDKNVIVIMEKRKGNQAEAKAARERHEQHVFVSCALGAPRIARVDGPLMAAQLAKEEPESWAWLLVEKGMYDDATDALREASLPGKKRKTVIADSHVDAQLQVVSDEWLYQSLIAGALLDEVGMELPPV